MLRPFLSAAVLVLGIASAHAEEASTQVPYGDLDLSQPADAKVLASRLQDAAKSVCLQSNPDIVRQKLLQNCIDMSVSIAMARVEDGLDQAVHAKLSNVRMAMETP